MTRNLYRTGTITVYPLSSVAAIDNPAGLKVEIRNAEMVAMNRQWSQNTICSRWAAGIQFREPGERINYVKRAFRFCRDFSAENSIF